MTRCVTSLVLHEHLYEITVEFEHGREHLRRECEALAVHHRFQVLECLQSKLLCFGFSLGSLGCGCLTAVVSQAMQDGDVAINKRCSEVLKNKAIVIVCSLLQTHHRGFPK